MKIQSNFKDNVLAIVGIAVTLLLMVALNRGLGDTYPASSVTESADLAFKLRRAIQDEDSFAAVSILKSAKDFKDIRELAEKASHGFGNSVTYSVLVDGDKDTVTFYHVRFMGGTSVQPVAAIVKNNSEIN